MTVIDGKKLRDGILEEIKREVASLSFKPVFCDVLVGEDPVLVQYVLMKNRYAKKVGIDFYDAKFPFDISTEKIVEEIKKINTIENMCGIIVQLPLPEHLDNRSILDSVNESLDVDCLNSKTTEKFYEGVAKLSFPTALACVYVLDSLKIALEDKNIVVLGQGNLVGKPVSYLLKKRGYKVAVVDSSTKEEEKKNLIKSADIIISAIGKGRYLLGDMVKQGVIIIDAGTSEENGAVVGDVDFDSVKEVASYVSPTPGGVGPVTVAMLLRNVLYVATSRKE